MDVADSQSHSVLFQGWLGGWVGGWVGGVDKLRIKLSQLSTKVEVEVEAELGNRRLNALTAVLAVTI